MKEYIEAPDGLQIEFKEASQNYQFEKLVDYCVALANEGGRKIIFGATDRRPRRIVGAAAFSEPGRTEGDLFDRLRPRVPVEELFTPEGTRVVIVHVPARLPGTAWQHNSCYLKRAGEDLVALGDVELKSIFAEADLDFSAEACPGATFADLSQTAIADFRTRWAKKVADPRRLPASIAAPVPP